MALLASQCRNGALWSRILPRTSLLLSQRTPDRKIAVRSEKFPEYSVIYDFEKIRGASRFNRVKYLMSVFVAGAVPASAAVQYLTGIIAPSTVQSFTFFGTVVVIFLHSCGFLFNDVVGYIYLHDDKETVKISSVGYWGQRVDFETKADNIQTFSDSAPRFNNPWYQRICLNDTKKSFKLYHTAGKILDGKTFVNIFGDVK